MVHRRDTLSDLASDAVREGAAPAIARLRAITPPETFESFHVIRSGGGKAAKRTSLGVDPHIDYQEYSAPDLWRPPYAIVRVGFSAKEPGNRYMAHSGEEVLLPISGAVQYQAWWSPGGKLQRVTLEKPIVPGAVVRWSPQVPHHTWAANGSDAEAWMVLRDPHSAASSVTILPPWAADLEARRLLTSEQLDTPIEFALRAWDVGPALARCREDAGLSLRDIGYFCGVDPTQLSRIESGSAAANISLEAFIRVARFLRVGLVNLIENADWFCLTDKIGSVAKDGYVVPLRLRPPGDHRVHVRVLDFEPNQGEVDLRPIDDAPVMTWVIVAGSGLVSFRERNQVRLEAVSEGGVVHFRRNAPTRVEARSKLRVFEVTYSTLCRCAEPSVKRNPLANG